MRRFFTLSIALLLAAASGLAQGQLQQLPNDPEVKTGKLENGLTYYIRHNAKPEKRAEFYLATDVGAMQETPDQDGLAHFLEHMCFNGTKNFPGKDLLNWLQSIGASFGGNVNAATGFEQTQYMLNNIPLVRETVLDSCLLVLHDYSHFVTNDPEEIDKERGVIVEERRARRDASWRLFERSLPYYYGDTKYATCTLIGSQENLETFKPESLTSFYQTWYRPDLQAVIVVGDIDVDKVEQKIKTIFSDIPAAENPKEKELIRIPAHEEPWVGVLTDPEGSTPSIEILWKGDAKPEELNSTPVGYMSDVLESIIASVMSERFDEITSKAQTPFLSGSLVFGKLCESTEVTAASVSLKPESILPSFKSFYTEIERMRRFGLTEAEVQRAKDRIIASLDRAAKQAGTRTNSEFVHPLINHFFDNEAYMTPETELQLAKGILQQVGSAVINQVIKEGLTWENASIVYTGPEKEGVATPSKEEILGAMSEIEASEIEAPAQEESDAALMDPSSLKGAKVKKTKLNEDLGFTEWTLKNGVKVMALKTDHKADQVLMKLCKEGGKSLVETDDLASFDENVYGLFQANQGVSSFSGTQLSKMLAGKNVSVSPFVSGLYNGLDVSSSVADLETAFQLLYLNFVEPRFESEPFDNAVSQLKSVLPTIVGQPDFIFQKTVNDILYKNNPRAAMISEEIVGKASLEAVERNYRKLFENAAGATLVIVGDFEPEAIKPLVEKYVGSLPKGGKPLHWQDRRIDLARGRIEHPFKQDMETPLSTVFQAYSLYKPYTVKDDVMVSAVRYILSQVYTDTLREDEGGTYGAAVGASGIALPTPKYLLQVKFNSKPALVERLKTLAVEGMRRLAKEGPTDEQFTRTIENLKKGIPEKRIRNAYWLDCIVDFDRFGVNRDKEYEEAVAGMTKESIQAAAKELVESGNFIEVVMEPGRTTETE